MDYVHRSSPVATVILPAYNEERAIGVVLQKLIKFTDDQYEVIVVDDGSSDDTSRIASRFPYRVIRHERNKGKCAAMKTGIKEARGKHVIFADADDTYPVEAIPQLVERLENGYDLALGARITGANNIPLINRFGNRLFRTVLRYLFGCKVSDPLTGLYGIKGAHLLKLDLVSQGFGVEAEIAIKASKLHLRIVEIPIHYRERLGKPKLRPFRDGVRIVWTMMTLLPQIRPRLFWLTALSGIASFTVFTIWLIQRM